MEVVEWKQNMVGAIYALKSGETNDMENDEVNDSDESFGVCKRCGNTLFSFSEVKDSDGLCISCDTELENEKWAVHQIATTL